MCSSRRTWTLPEQSRPRSAVEHLPDDGVAGQREYERLQQQNSSSKPAADNNTNINYYIPSSRIRSPWAAPRRSATRWLTSSIRDHESAVGVAALTEQLTPNHPPSSGPRRAGGLREENARRPRGKTWKNGATPTAGPTVSGFPINRHFARFRISPLPTTC